MGLIVILLSFLAVLPWVHTGFLLHAVITDYHGTVDKNYRRYLRIGRWDIWASTSVFLSLLIMAYITFVLYVPKSPMHLDMFVHMFLSGGMVYYVTNAIIIYLGYRADRQLLKHITGG